MPWPHTRFSCVTPSRIDTSIEGLSWESFSMPQAAPLPKGFLADSLNRIQPSLTIAITQKERDLKAAGQNRFGGGAGNPDSDTPKNIRGAATPAFRAGKTKYPPVE